jgi:alpha-aminoadipic semialdehyde synthase
MKMALIGIRREDKNRWEKRAPLIPEHVEEFNKKGIVTVVQPSKIRTYSDNEYLKHGAQVKEDLSECQTIFAIKEIPLHFFEPEKTYVFFSHTIKGQKHNMPMLKRMMELKCNLIDYEKITDKHGRRLVFFGRYAGIAGMVDTLWAFGKRLTLKNIDSPLSEIKQTIFYKNLQEIKDHFREIGNKIEKVPIAPLIIGFAGYGNVSKGAQEIIDLLPVREIAPKEIKRIYENPSDKLIYKVVFKEEDMVEPLSGRFDLQEYYEHPERYRPIFERYVPYLNILVNCIYWEPKYPRLITKDFVRRSKNLRLEVIGDISCDINGSIEFTEKPTSPDSPVFVYNPLSDKIEDGYKGEGIVVMAVDNLPCELPRESSSAFSNSLFPFVPHIAKADFSGEFEKCKLPPEVKKAIILYKGELTPPYKYIDKYL